MKINKKYIYITLIIICAFSLIYMDTSNTNKKLNEQKKTVDKKQIVIQEPTTGKIISDLMNKSPNKQHPRLMITKEDFLRIKESISSDEYLKKWYAELNKDANDLLSTPVVIYEKSDGKRLLPVSRTVLDRIITLSLMYRLSGDTQYADRAWKELEVVSNEQKFINWNSSHFLDTAEMASAVSIGYDWLYDYLNEQQKRTLQNSLINNALKPGLEVYTNNPSNESLSAFWKNSTNNWNTVCNSGLILASLAIADESVETEKLSSEIIKYAISSVQRSLKSYPDDGGTEEGPSYWNYATKYLAFFLSSMDASLGTDYGLSKIRGLSETGYYPIYVTGYDGVFNIGDGRESDFDNLSQLFWLSNRYNKPQIASPALKIYNPLNIVWYKVSKSKENYDTSIPLDKTFKGEKTGIVTMRGSWKDSNSFFVGIHGGDNQASHGDLDVGTFVLDVLGVRWAGELGAEDYNSKGYSDLKSGRWLYYRKRTEGQNTLVISSNNNTNQNKEAKGKIKDFNSNKNEASVTIDMTSAYENADSIQRKLELVDNRSKVIIEDNISLSKESEIFWFMHTRAKIGLSPDLKTAVLVRKGKVLYAQIKSPVKANFSIMNAQPLPNSPSVAKQNINQDIQKLTINMQNVKKTNIIVEFSIDPPKE
ncbi:heparinase II/III family protein [Niallia taxi]|uniref:heparinase II/III domain-containing protein n=1 Tax=Niallia taxi TaxID=2499688 RepID=UPI00317B69A3